MAQRIKTAARALLIVLLVATILLFLFFRPAAYLAAIPLPVLFVVWIYAAYLEQNARVSVLRQRGATTIGKEEIEMDVRYSGIYYALIIFGLLAAGTFVIAAAVYDWEMVGIAATALLLLIVLMTSPFVPVAISEVERDEREKFSGPGDADASEDVPPR